MTALLRAPCVVDYSLSTTAPTITKLVQPVRAERFTVEQVQDPQVLADQLTRINRLALDASHDVRSSALGAPVVHQGLAVTSGSTLTIQHGLGRKVFWWPVGFVGSTDARLSLNAATDTNTLVLNVYATGTLDLAVA